MTRLLMARTLATLLAFLTAGVILYYNAPGLNWALGIAKGTARGMILIVADIVGADGANATSLVFGQMSPQKTLVMSVLGLFYLCFLAEWFRVRAEHLYRVLFVALAAHLLLIVCWITLTDWTQGYYDAHQSALATLFQRAEWHTAETALLEDGLGIHRWLVALEAIVLCWVLVSAVLPTKRV